MLVRRRCLSVEEEERGEGDGDGDRVGRVFVYAKSGLEERGQEGCCCCRQYLEKISVFVSEKT